MLLLYSLCCILARASATLVSCRKNSCICEFLYALMRLTVVSKATQSISHHFGLLTTVYNSRRVWTVPPCFSAAAILDLFDRCYGEMSRVPSSYSDFSGCYSWIFF